MPRKAVYLYALVRSKRRPSLTGAPSGLPQTGPLRLVDAGHDVWLVTADAPLSRYGSEPIERGLRDVDWVSRCALAHEQVVRHFSRRLTAVPMRLFTLFSSEERALTHVNGKDRGLRRVFDRVEGCEEWGVRVSAAAAAIAKPEKTPAKLGSGREFLERKREQHLKVREMAKSAPRAAKSVLKEVARHARARKELPIVASAGKTLLLADTALLVPRDSRSRFRAAVARAAEDASRRGIHIVLTGPWPPYNFVDGSR